MAFHYSGKGLDYSCKWQKKSLDYSGAGLDYFGIVEFNILIIKIKRQIIPPGEKSARLDIY